MLQPWVATSEGQSSAMTRTTPLEHVSSAPLRHPALRTGHVTRFSWLHSPSVPGHQGGACVKVSLCKMISINYGVVVKSTHADAWIVFYKATGARVRVSHTPLLSRCSLLWGDRPLQSADARSQSHTQPQGRRGPREQSGATMRDGGIRREGKTHTWRTRRAQHVKAM